MELCEAYLLLKQVKKAASISKEALTIAEKLKFDSEHLEECQNFIKRLTLCYQLLQENGALKDALPLALKCLELQETYFSTENQAPGLRLNLMICRDYIKLNDIPSASAAAKKAILNYNKLLPSERNNYRTLCEPFKMCGEEFLKNNAYEEALQLYAIALTMDVTDSTNTLVDLVSIGRILLNLKNIDETKIIIEKILEEAHDIFYSAGDKIHYQRFAGALFQFGNDLFNSGAVNEALKCFESAQMFTYPWNTEPYLLTMHICRCYFKLSLWQEALDLANKALSNMNKKYFVSQWCQVLSDHFIVHAREYNQGNDVRSIPFYEIALKLMYSAPTIQVAKLIELQLSLTYNYLLLQNMDEATKATQQVVYLAKMLPAPLQPEYAKSFRDLAMPCINKFIANSAFKDALSLRLITLQLDSLYSTKFQLMLDHTDICLLQSRLRNHTGTAYHVKQALQLATKECLIEIKENLDYFTTRFCDFGSKIFACSDYNSALALYLQSKELNLSSTNKLKTSSILLNICATLLKLNQRTEAISAMQEALQILQVEGLKFEESNRMLYKNLSENLEFRGSDFLKLKDFSHARLLFQQALSFANPGTDTSKITENLMCCTLYLDSKNPKELLDFSNRVFKEDQNNFIILFYKRIVELNTFSPLDRFSLIKCYIKLASYYNNNDILSEIRSNLGFPFFEKTINLIQECSADEKESTDYENLISVLFKFLLDGCFYKEKVLEFTQKLIAVVEPKFRLECALAHLGIFSRFSPAADEDDEDYTESEKATGLASMHLALKYSEELIYKPEQDTHFKQLISDFCTKADEYCYSDTESTLLLYDRALKLSITLPEKSPLTALIHLQIAKIYRKNNQFDKMTDSATKALSAADNLGFSQDYNQEYLEPLSDALFNHADWLFRERKDYPQSILFHKKAIVTIQYVNNWVYLAKYLIELPVTQFRLVPREEHISLGECKEIFETSEQICQISEKFLTEKYYSVIHDYCDEIKSYFDDLLKFLRTVEKRFRHPPLSTLIDKLLIAQYRFAPKYEKSDLITTMARNHNWKPLELITLELGNKAPERFAESLPILNTLNTVTNGVPGALPAELKCLTTFLVTMSLSFDKESNPLYRQPNFVNHLDRIGASLDSLALVLRHNFADRGKLSSNLLNKIVLMAIDPDLKDIPSSTLLEVLNKRAEMLKGTHGLLNIETAQKLAPQKEERSTWLQKTSDLALIAFYQQYRIIQNQAFSIRHKGSEFQQASALLKEVLFNKIRVEIPSRALRELINFEFGSMGMKKLYPYRGNIETALDNALRNYKQFDKCFASVVKEANEKIQKHYEEFEINGKNEKIQRNGLFSGQLFALSQELTRTFVVQHYQKDNWLFQFHKKERLAALSDTLANLILQKYIALKNQSNHYNFFTTSKEMATVLRPLCFSVLLPTKFTYSSDGYVGLTGPSTTTEIVFFQKKISLDSTEIEAALLVLFQKNKKSTVASFIKNLPSINSILKHEMDTADSKQKMDIAKLKHKMDTTDDQGISKEAPSPSISAPSSAPTQKTERVHYRTPDKDEALDESSAKRAKLQKIEDTGESSDKSAKSQKIDDMDESSDKPVKSQKFV